MEIWIEVSLNYQLNIIQWHMFIVIYQFNFCYLYFFLIWPSLTEEIFPPVSRNKSTATAQYLYADNWEENHKKYYLGNVWPIGSWSNWQSISTQNEAKPDIFGIEKVPKKRFTFRKYRDAYSAIVVTQRHIYIYIYI